MRKGFQEDPVLEEVVLTGELHKDTHEEQHRSLDELTIYQFQNILFTLVQPKMIKVKSLQEISDKMN